MMVRTAYTQWAVGEGFFHSGRNRADETPGLEIVHVFDCGAHGKFNKALHREIDEFRRRYDHLDLLFISHFHLDHVSGLEHLLQNRPARHIIAPLLPPEERLLAFAIALGDGTGAAVLPPWYPGLVADPEGTLALLSPNTPVTFVEPGAGQEAAPLLGSQLESLRDDALEFSFGGPSGTSEGVRPQASLHAGTQPIWIWQAWLPAAMSSHAADFGVILKGILPPNLRNLGDTATLNTLVIDHQDDLRKAYKDLLKKPGGSERSADSNDTTAKDSAEPDLNLTSLSMYCGPAVTGTRSWRARHIDGDEVAERAEVYAWGVRPGWLGTGDACLRDGTAAAEFNDYFRNLKTEVGIFAIPHHGSEGSWNAGLLEGFDQPPACVVGADDYMGWRHPGHEVVQSVNAAGSVVVVATSDERSRWTDVSSTRFGT